MSVNEIKTNGITLFTLKSDFKEDETKNCGLLGKEIDGNFLFLRNNDIYKGEIIENNLILHRGGNLDDIVVSGINESFRIINGNYDNIKDVLTIETTNGLIEITGISTNNIIHTITPIKGDGSVNSPIHLSSLYISPFLPSVKTLVDKTNGETIPESLKNTKVNVLTKEHESDYGYLYNFAAVKQIENELTLNRSHWRIPSNSDWYEMLNALELCDDRTHNQRKNGDYGKFAGAYLKNDGVDWLTTTPVSYSYGFKALPSGIKISGDPSLIGKGNITVFWSNTTNRLDEVWVRQLDSSNATVKLRSVDKDGFYSLRLVMDYDHDISEDEILDKTYEIIKMPYVKLNENGEVIENGYRLWTATNISHEVENNSIIIENDDFKYKYFINHWNGLYWEKRRLEENDIICIEDRENKEYKLINETLIQYGNINNTPTDLSDYYNKTEIDKKIKKLNDDIDFLKRVIVHLTGARLYDINENEIYKLDTVITQITSDKNEISVNKENHTIYLDFNPNVLGNITDI